MYVPGERNVLGAFGSAPDLCSPCCGSVLGAVGTEAGSGKVELIWEGGSRRGRNVMGARSGNVLRVAIGCFHLCRFRLM